MNARIAIPTPSKRTAFRIIALAVLAACGAWLWYTGRFVNRTLTAIGGGDSSSEVTDVGAARVNAEKLETALGAQRRKAETDPELRPDAPNPFRPVTVPAPAPGAPAGSAP